MSSSSRCAEEALHPCPPAGVSGFGIECASRVGPIQRLPHTGRTVTVIILAAGRGARFLASGGPTHKLDALLCGKPVLWHVMQAVQASGLDWHLVRPAAATAGMGETIAMGVKAAADAPGWLILPGDLPLVRGASLKRVAEALTGHAVVVPHYRSRRGHPVGFRNECLAALAALSGDAGAASVVHAYRQNGQVLELPLNDAGICLDVDTVQDLHRAQRRLARLAHLAHLRDARARPAVDLPAAGAAR
jgi:molybdenum cofactor cytidylyltransferase